MIEAVFFRRTFFAGLSLACCMAFTGCGSKPDETATSLSRLPFGVIDVPRSGETLRGAVGLGGWALSEDGISRIAIYVDRNYVLAATIGGPRPDVAKVYPGFTDAATSGWNAVLDITAFPAGPHEILVQAQSKHGAVRDLGNLAATFAK